MNVITKKTVRNAIKNVAEPDGDSICLFLLGEHRYDRRHVNRAEQCKAAVYREDLSRDDYLRVAEPSK